MIEPLETFHGRYYTYKVRRGKGGLFSGPDFWVDRDDGKLYGSFSTADAAIEAAKELARG